MALQYTFSHFGRVIHYINVANATKQVKSHERTSSKIASIDKKQAITIKDTNNKGFFSIKAKRPSQINKPSSIIGKLESFKELIIYKEEKALSKEEPFYKEDEEEKALYNKPPSLQKESSLKPSTFSSSSEESFLPSQKEIPSPKPFIEADLPKESHDSLKKPILLHNSSYEDFEEEEEEKILSEILHGRKAQLQSLIPLTFLDRENQQRGLYEEENRIILSRKKKNLEVYFKWKLKKWDSLQKPENERKSVFAIPCRFFLYKIYVGNL